MQSFFDFAFVPPTVFFCVCETIAGGKNTKLWTSLI